MKQFFGKKKLAKLVTLSVMTGAMFSVAGSAWAKDTTGPYVASGQTVIDAEYSGQGELHTGYNAVYAEGNNSITFNGTEISLSVINEGEGKITSTDYYPRVIFSKATTAGRPTINLGTADTEMITLVSRAESPKKQPNAAIVAGNDSESTGENIGGGAVVVRGKELNINVTALTADRSVFGIIAQNRTTKERSVSGEDKRPLIDISTDKTTITTSAYNNSGDDTAIVAFSQGMINIQSNLTTYSTDAIAVRGDAIVKINTDDGSNKSTVLNGNIDYDYDGGTSGSPTDASVEIVFRGSSSKWVGNSILTFSEMPDENYNKEGSDEGSREKLLKVTGLNLSFVDGGTWIPTFITEMEDTKDSSSKWSGKHQLAVNTLTMNKGAGDGGKAGVIDFTTEKTAADTKVMIDTMKGTEGVINMSDSAKVVVDTYNIDKLTVNAGTLNLTNDATSQLTLHDKTNAGNDGEGNDGQLIINTTNGINISAPTADSSGSKYFDVWQNVTFNGGKAALENALYAEKNAKVVFNNDSVEAYFLGTLTGAEVDVNTNLVATAGINANGGTIKLGSDINKVDYTATQAAKSVYAKNGQIIGNVGNLYIPLCNYGLYTESGGEIDISADSFTVDKAGYHGLYATSGGEIEISADSFTVDKAGYYALAAIGGTIKLQSSNINVKDAQMGVVSTSRLDIISDNKIEFTNLPYAFISQSGGIINVTAKDIVLSNCGYLANNNDPGSEINIVADNITVTQDYSKTEVLSTYKHGLIKVNSGKDTGIFTINKTVTNESEYFYGFACMGNSGGVPGGKVEIGGEALNINITDKSGGTVDVRAIHASNNYISNADDDNRTFITLASKNTNIVLEDESGNPMDAVAFSVMSEGKVVVDSNLYVKADTVLCVRGNSDVYINIDGKHTTELYGDINFAYEGETSGSPTDASVEIVFRGSSSKWVGNSILTFRKMPDENYNKEGSGEGSREKLLKVTGLNLSFVDGGTWIPTFITEMEDTKDSSSKWSGKHQLAVNTLTMNAGIIDMTTDATADNTKAMVENLIGESGVVKMDADNVLEVAKISNKDLTVNGGKLVYSTDAEAKVDAGEKLTLNGTDLDQAFTNAGELNINNTVVDVKLTNNGTMNINGGKLADVATVNDGSVTNITGDVTAHSIASQKMGVTNINKDVTTGTVNIEAKLTGNGNTNANAILFQGLKATGSSADIKGGKMYIGGENLNVNIIDDTTGDYVAIYGVHTATNTLNFSKDEEQAHTIINAKNTNVSVLNSSNEVTLGGVAFTVMSKGILEVDSNLTAKANCILATRGEAKTKINVAENKTVKLDGDIEFNYDAATSGTKVDASVDLRLTDKNSYWTGKIVKSSDTDPIPEGKADVSGMQLTLKNDATWTMTGDSFVNNLTVDGATIAKDTSVHTLTLQGGNSSITNSTVDANLVVASDVVLTVNGAVSGVGDMTLAGKLNLQNGKTAAFNDKLAMTGTFTANAGAKIAFDAKIGAAEAVASDSISVACASGAITIDTAKITVSGDTSAVGSKKVITLFTGTDLTGLIITGDAIATSDGYKYDFKQDETNKGNLVTTKDYGGTLPQIVQNNPAGLGKVATYILTSDYTTPADLGTLTRVETSTPREFTINGNNHKLLGGGYQGVKVDAGDTLNLINLKDMSGFGTALTVNSGAVANLNNVTFSGNTADISNAGTVNLSGTVTANSISGAGTLSNAGTLNIGASGLQNSVTNTGTVNLGAGTLGVAVTGGTLNVNGDVTANADYIAGTINNVVDGKTLTLDGGAVANAITNSGTVKLTGVTGMSAAVTGGTLSIEQDLTADASYIAGNDNIVADGKTLTLDGGAVANAITNSGTVKLTGVTGMSAAVNGGVLSVEQDLTTSADNIKGATNNVATDKTLTLNSGAVANAITNSGTVKLTGVTGMSAAVNGGVLNIEQDLTADASYIGGDTNNVVTGKTVNLIGGVLGKPVTGGGDVIVGGTVSSDLVYLNNSGLLSVDQGATLTLTGSSDLTRKIEGNGNVAIGGTISADLADFSSNSISVNSGAKLILSCGSDGYNVAINNQGSIDLVSGIYSESFVADVKDTGIVNLKDKAIYETTAAMVYTNPDTTTKDAGAVTTDAKAKINFVGGTLALTDTEYTMDYAKSAQTNMSNVEVNSKKSNTQVVMLGNLINFTENEIDVQDAGKVGSDVALDKVEAKTQEKNLLVGSGKSDQTLFDDQYVTAVEKGFSVKDLNLEEHSTGMIITNDENVTLGGTEGGNLIKVGGEEKIVKVVVGVDEKTTVIGVDEQPIVVKTGILNIGNPAVAPETEFVLKGSLLVNKDSEVNVKGQTEITEKVELKGGTANVAEGAKLSTPLFALDDSFAHVSQAAVVEAKNITVDSTEKAEQSRKSVITGKVTAESLNMSKATGDVSDKTVVLNVGTDKKQAKVEVKDTKLNDNMLFLDPAWKSGTNLVGDASHYATETTDLDGAYVVGRNSILTFGATNADADALFGSTGLKWGETDVSAAAYVANNINVANGSLMVDGSKTQAPPMPAAGTVNFAANSLFMVNGDNCQGSAVVTGVKSATVADSSKLFIANAIPNTTYKILAGEGITSGWLKDNVVVKGTIGGLDVELDGTYFNVTTGETGFSVPGTVMPNVAETILNGGQSKALDALETMTKAPTKEQQAANVNAYANLGENLGVTRGAYDVANMVGNAVTEHWDNNAKGENIWAVYTHSKDKVDGLKLGGMDAQYDAQYNGVTVGYDINKDFGIALNHVDGNVSNGYGGHNDAKYYGISVYGRKNFGKVNLLGDVTYSHGKNELEQNGISADAKTNTFSMGVTAKYATNIVKVGNVTPFAGVRYVRIDGKDYTDSIGVNREADKVNSLIVPMGVEYSAEFNVSGSDWNCRPVLALGYLFNFGDKDNTMTLGYNGAKDSFGYDFVDNGAFFTKAALNFTKKNLTLGVGYDYMKSSNSHNNRWNVNMNYAF